MDKLYGIINVHVIAVKLKAVEIGKVQFLIIRYAGRISNRLRHHELLCIEIPPFPNPGKI